MTVLGEFHNHMGDHFVLSRHETEIWIDGSEFGWQPHNVALLDDFMFGEEEKAEIDRIVSLDWRFLPHLPLDDLLTADAMPDQRFWKRHRAVCRQLADFIADGLLPQATHRPGCWLIWDTVEQVEFLRRHGESITIAQYALLRGFATPEDGAAFLHRYAEAAGCVYVTHLDNPAQCWFQRYELSMAEWLQVCDEMRQKRNQDVSARLALVA
jgi:hypothetical protein